MKICPNCNNSINDDDEYCYHCGMEFVNEKHEENTNLITPDQAPKFEQENKTEPNTLKSDSYDHTSEFTPEDIKNNKVMALAAYLLGPIGIVIALLASSTSPYVAFHVRQVMKFNILALLCMVFLFWTILIPLAFIIMSPVFAIIYIICIFQVFTGKAKEPAIIRSMKFLN